MNPFKRSTEPTACPSCKASAAPGQLSCLECGTMLDRRGRLSGVAWQLPVATVAAVFLLLATGIGYASGAVIQDGDVSVAEAPPGEGPLPGQDGPGEAGAGGDGGSDDLAQLDPPAPGDGDGDDSDLDDGGNGDGDGDDDDGDDGDGDDGDDGDGGSDGAGGGADGGERGSSNGGAEAGSPDELPEFTAPPEARDLAEFPPGGSGYTVALKVTSSRSAALREARAAANEAEGIPAGVISRSNFPGLPGAFVTFAGGPFDSRAAAERARDDYATLGFSGEVIQVGSGG